MFRKLKAALSETKAVLDEIERLGKERKEFSNFVEKLEKLIKKKRCVYGCKFLTFGISLSLHEICVLNRFLDLNYESKIKRLLPHLYLISCRNDTEDLAMLFDDF